MGQTEPIFDVSPGDIDRALAACDGDARATIRALLIANAMLERALTGERVAALQSRRRPSRRQ
ncbi:hypothetical protein J5J86_13845 [Aquabacter sp. L1I39]|uniref:hypothetical protein n=1 Tax=Aquabacter sp. L1I39 TaxID=2820278 RepID=UPI001ADB7B6C|nr:hypothetical protein [Aquabacter sp. L1I39]QTL01888.1 hypothetical protein J5J86_13845 [Aquabacter sp. L1I39]